MRVLTKRQRDAIIRNLEKRRVAVGAERDKLREMVDDIEALAETCDRAEEALQTAIDAMSELA